MQLATTLPFYNFPELWRRCERRCEVASRCERRCEVTRTSARRRGCPGLYRVAYASCGSFPCIANVPERSMSGPATEPSEPRHPTVLCPCAAYRRCLVRPKCASGRLGAELAAS